MYHISNFNFYSVVVKHNFGLTTILVVFSRAEREVTVGIRLEQGRITLEKNDLIIPLLLS